MLYAQSDIFFNMANIIYMRRHWKQAEVRVFTSREKSKPENAEIEKEQCKRAAMYCIC